MFALVIYDAQTNNFLIAGFIALEAVPQYDAAYKYLSIFMMLFLILTNQLWSANIEAYRKRDMEWMRKSMKTVAKIWLATVGLEPGPPATAGERPAKTDRRHA